MASHGADAPSDPGATERGTPPSKPRTRASRAGGPPWGWMAIGIALLLLLGVTLLPPLLSTDLARERILARVNERLSGRLSVGDWSIGWFSGVAFKDVRLDDADGQPVFEAKAIIVSANIPGLLRSKKRLRTTLIESPRLHLVLDRKGRLRLGQVLRAPAATGLPPSASQSGVRNWPPRFDLRGGLIVRHGEILTRPEDGGPAPAIHDLDAGVQIGSLARPAHVRLRFTLGEARPPVFIEGDLTLLPGPEQGSAGEFVARTKEFPLSALSPIALRLERPFLPEGMVDAEFRAHFSGRNTLRAELDLDARDLALHPPASPGVGSRIPRLKMVAAAVREGRETRLERLLIESVPVELDLAGEFLLPEGAEEPTLRVAGQARADLAALAAFLPHPPRLPAGAQIKGGLLTLSGEWSRAPALARVRAEAAIERLDFTARDQRVLLDGPVTLALTAGRSPQGLRVERFILDSPFGRIAAAGTAEDFECALSADVTRLATEARKFAPGIGASAQGRAEARLRVTSPEARCRRAEMRLDLGDFLLSSLTRKPLAFRSVTFTGAATAELDDAGRFTGAREISGAFTAPAVALAFSAARLNPRTPEHPFPALSGGRMTIEGDLAEALTLAQGGGVLPKAVEIRGGFRLDSDLELADGILRAETLELALGEIAFALMEQRVVEPKVLFRAHGLEAEPAARRFALREAELETSWATTRLDDIRAEDWAAFPRGFAGRARMDLNLDRVKEILRRIDLLPARFDVTGQVQASARITPGPEIPRLSVSLVANDLKLLMENQPSVDEKRASLDLDRLWTGPDGLTAGTVTIASTYFSLSGRGRLNLASAPAELETEGALVLDFDRIGPLAARWLRRPLTLSGRHAGPVKLVLRFVEGDWKAWLRGMTGEAALRADRAAAYGLEGTDLAAAVRTRSGRLELDLGGKVNGGPLTAHLLLDASGDPPLLRLVERGVLFSGARVTHAAAAEMLTRLNPLFEQSASPQGVMTLALNEVSTPITAGARAGTILSGTLSLKGLSFAPGGMLRRVLALSERAEPARVYAPDQNIAFEFRDGVLRHAPLTLRAGGVTLRTQASRRAEGSLDCRVEIPCTLDMVGRDRALFERLKGEVFRLTIGGSAGAPEPDLKAFQEDLAARIGAARLKMARERATEELNRALDQIFRAE